MSKYDQFSTAIRDRETLLAALAECGYSEGKVEVHEQPVTLYDYHGAHRPERAHVVIRRQFTGIDASNDIGFVRQADGTFKAIVSDYDQSALRILNGKPVERNKANQTDSVPFLQAVQSAHARMLNETMIQRVVGQVRKLKLRGIVPAHATPVRVQDGNRVDIRLRW